MADKKGKVRRMKRGPPAGSHVAEGDGGESDGLAFPRSQDHFDRYTKLIRLELEDEMESVEERLENGVEVVWLRMESPCLI